MFSVLFCLIVSLSIPQILDFVNTKPECKPAKCGVDSKPNIHATLEYNYITNDKLIIENHIKLMEKISIKQE